MTLYRMKRAGSWQ